MCAPTAFGRHNIIIVTRARTIVRCPVTHVPIDLMYVMIIARYGGHWSRVYDVRDGYALGSPPPADATRIAESDLSRVNWPTTHPPTASLRLWVHSHTRADGRTDYKIDTSVYDAHCYGRPVTGDNIIMCVNGARTRKNYPNAREKTGNNRKVTILLIVWWLRVLRW